MNLEKLINYIEKIAPLAAAASWDRSGVQVASFKNEVTNIAIMLDPTFHNIEVALSKGADFILAHHPFSMSPLFPDKLDDYNKALRLLIKNDAWLYSAHTSLDANPNGPVRWLAKELKLSNLALIEPFGDDNYGFGFIGDLPHAVSYPVFCQSLAAFTQKSSWSASGQRPEMIKKVACCPGSGTALINEVTELNADVFITGDLKYHTALDTKIRIIDIGHFQLEEIMMLKLSQQITEDLPSLTVNFIASSDPIVRECFDKHNGGYNSESLS